MDHKRCIWFRTSRHLDYPRQFHPRRRRHLHLKQMRGVRCGGNE